ncbi:uncharacterized protein LOC103718426 isoform X1 [Phoenix dactylifera]|uniref:Uncharacterized protein LOC103718426 isoform X1 n=1 Tax=Phoenix dactylifera TaxID=42345 RepID=A0A8B7CSI1_PHODC|nr:uncharacterized protein LOC103718426 isoform X1 [Phoenix dactylifera]
MVRSGDPEATSEIWGTLEELLLGCAVSRHGTRSWDSVAMEVRSRSPSAYHLLLTPECCRERYRDLERRFSAADGEIGGGGGGPGVEIPWLEELRKLRVAELRREVQRYDVSILSLQLKVKTLQEERERSFLGEEDEDDKNGPDRDEEERKNGESPGSTRRNIPGDRISDGDSRRSGRSCKESNSTDPKDEEEKPRAGETEAAPGTEDRRTDRATSGDVKSAGEASYNGSSDTIAKAAAMANTARPPALADSGASLAESKGGEAEAEREGAKESSDVQSSASLSSRQRRRSGRRKVFSGCSSGGDEPETDAVSPGAKRVPAVSQPLITFVEFIRAHKFGSVFERRLQSQKSVRYRSMIRRHVDLEMVRGKLEGRGRREAYRSAEFFRDLLLLCYNAIVFYPKSSPESIAAVHLRGLVTKEMAGTIRKPARRPNAEEPIPPAQPFSPPAVSKLKSDPDRASKALEKQTSLVPLTACRKRSSLSGKAAAAGGWKEGRRRRRSNELIGRSGRWRTKPRPRRGRMRDLRCPG